MEPKIIIIFAVAYLYGFFGFFMILRLRNKNKGSSSCDKGSLWWLSVFVKMIPGIFGYLFRIKVVERFLLEQLGEEYQDYQQ